VLEELQLRLLPYNRLPPHELMHNPPPPRAASRIVGYLNPPPVMENPLVMEKSNILSASSRRSRRSEAIRVEGVTGIRVGSERTTTSKWQTRLEQRRGMEEGWVSSRRLSPWTSSCSSLLKLELHRQVGDDGGVEMKHRLEWRWEEA
jgi:hypothetical protein